MENTIIEQACNDTFDNPKFQSDYIQLTTSELSNNKIKLSSEQISKLLQTASLFSLAHEEKYQKLAFKIAIYLLNQYRSEFDSIPYAVEIILTRLGDIPAISSMVVNQEGKDYFGFFGKNYSSEIIKAYLRFPEVLAKKVTNTVKIANVVKPLTLTDFQSKIYFMLRAGKNVSFSAPTSAGKSFMVHHFIAEKIKSSTNFCAVYIVPTRALIAEVQESIRKTILELGVNPETFAVFVSANKLNITEIAATHRKVFVLTQERLQEAMANNPLRDVNLLVIDEAQKVDDETRGIIIQDAVDDLLYVNSSVQKLFIAPYIDNPEELKTIFGIPDEVIPEQTAKSPVGQNIITVDFSNRTVMVSVNSYELRKTDVPLGIPLNFIELSERTYSNAERKAWVATHLIPEIPKPEPTIVYCDKPSDCRLAAKKIIEMRGKVSPSDELKSAIDFFAQQVHEDYYLCDVLQDGVGYHYGKMPNFVKFYIKELFDSGNLNILCCTSTLLEGVNLPAKNIIMCHPKTGRSINRMSVLNLAGRAGRLMEDHYGKIYCVDMKQWTVDGVVGKDVFEGKAEFVQSSVDITIQDHLAALIRYLNNADTPVRRRVKRLATSLMMKYLKKEEKDDVINFLQRSKNINVNDVEEIATLIQGICDNLELDRDVILRNRAIDPRFQDELYRALMMVNPNEDYVLPPFPSKQDKYFRWKMQAIFCQISIYLLRKKSKNGQYSGSWSYHGVLAYNWISEMPYKEILKGKIKYLKQKNETDKEFHNRAIESLDVDIERTLKFEYTRGLKCYADIFRTVLSDKGITKKKSCDELPIYLEWGTFNKNALLMMEFGLSRNISIILNNFVHHELMSSTECLVWLRLNKEGLKKSIAPIFIKEIERLLEVKSKENVVNSS